MRRLASTSLRAQARRRLSAADKMVERYRRAELEWHLNPTAGSEAERHQALRAVIDAGQTATITSLVP